MTNIDFNLGDDLSDMLGGDAPVTPRALPTDAASVRIREQTPVFAEQCPKCRGTGSFVGYTGRRLGQCFACKGAGKRTFKTAPEVRARAQQRTQQAKVEAITSKAAEIEWLRKTLLRADRLPEGYARMLQDFNEKLSNGYTLTDGQLGVIAKGMARDAQWAAEREQKAAASGTDLDVTAIRNVLQSRRKVMVALFTFSLAPEHGNNPGAIYVKDDGQYVGKIPAGASTFRPGRDFDQSRLPALREAMANPAEAVRADAARRAQMLLEDPTMSIPCGCCGIELTNPESIARGIGPICAGKWGF